MKDYAKLYNTSVSDIIRRSILERIEDELDMRAYEKAKAEYLADPVTYSLDEVGKELGIDEL
ncbi:MAG: CopG family transcriptional regulator [Phascolarctobacterium sp.]|nr:CopG family transcriptional regulator [Phascolarctobacterium sp.]